MSSELGIWQAVKDDLKDLSEALGRELPRDSQKEISNLGTSVKFTLSEYDP